MTVDEVTVILSILKTAYPQLYRNLSEDDTDDVIKLWAIMFEFEPVSVVTEAVKALICTLKFPPTIADVKEKIALIIESKSETEMEAWNKVFAAIKSARYNAQENFNNLPLVIQQIVGSPRQLREWAVMEPEALQSVVQSNFMRSYRAKVKSNEEYAALPESAKNLSEAIRKKMLSDGQQNIS